MIEGDGLICGCGCPKGPGVALVAVCVTAVIGAVGVGQLHFSGPGVCCAKDKTVAIRTSEIDFAERRRILIISPPGNSDVDSNRACDNRHGLVGDYFRPCDVKLSTKEGVGPPRADVSAAGCPDSIHDNRLT